MSKQEALELYIQTLFETDPEWEAKYAVTDDLVIYLHEISDVLYVYELSVFCLFSLSLC